MHTSQRNVMDTLTYLVAPLAMVPVTIWLVASCLLEVKETKEKERKKSSQFYPMICYLDIHY